MSVRRYDKHTLAVIAQTISIVTKIAEGGQSVISMSFDVKKQKLTLAVYGIANIYPRKKNNDWIALL